VELLRDGLLGAEHLDLALQLSNLGCVLLSDGAKRDPGGLGKIIEVLAVKRRRSSPLAARSRTRGQRTAAGPMPVRIPRSVPWARACAIMVTTGKCHLVGKPPGAYFPAIAGAVQDNDKRSYAISAGTERQSGRQAEGHAQ
jgi:hypothetical protein